MPTVKCGRKITEKNDKRRTQSLCAAVCTLVCCLSMVHFAGGGAFASGGDTLGGGTEAAGEGAFLTEEAVPALSSMNEESEREGTVGTFWESYAVFAAKLFGYG